MRLARIFCAFVAISMPSAVLAQAFPKSAVKIVVPYAAGGDSDLIARAIAHKLHSRWGQSVIVENKPGAGTMIGTDSVARAKPDGLTLLFTGPGFVTSQLEVNKITYDPQMLSPVLLAATSPLILYVNAALPLKTFQDVVDYAKNNPGKLSFGSSGHLSSPHLAAELLANATGTTIAHVPYKGIGPAVNDLLAGHINAVWAAPNLMQYVTLGKLRAIAAASDRRLSIAPDVPTTAEIGYPAIEVTTWGGMLVPSAVPDDVKREIVAGVVEALGAPETRRQIESIQYEPAKGTSEDFAKFLALDLKKWSKIIREQNLTAE